jgi:hypothetical protein
MINIVTSKRCRLRHHPGVIYQPGMWRKYLDNVHPHVITVFLLELHCAHTDRQEHAMEATLSMPKTCCILNSILHLCQLMTGVICIVD